MRSAHAALALLLLAAPGQADTGQLVTGKGHARDGDSIAFAGAQVRLYGIDAPELEQRCTNRRGRLYRCGQLAREALAAALERRPVRCVALGRDRYGRVLGRCRDRDGRDIAHALVRAGHAIAYRRFADDYVAAENAAREARAGMWQGDFIPPWQQRLNNRRRQVTAAPEAAAPRRAGCTIKGNISTRGRRIYHMPGQRHYAKTRIWAAKGERWFCSEREAKAAGWRRSRR